MKHWPSRYARALLPALSVLVSSCSETFEPVPRSEWAAIEKEVGFGVHDVDLVLESTYEFVASHYESSSEQTRAGDDIRVELGFEPEQIQWMRPSGQKGAIGAFVEVQGTVHVTLDGETMEIAESALEFRCLQDCGPEHMNLIVIEEGAYEGGWLWVSLDRAHAGEFVFTGYLESE